MVMSSAHHHKRAAHHMREAQKHMEMASKPEPARRRHRDEVEGGRKANATLRRERKEGRKV